MAGSLQGTPGILDTRNPTLLPNYYRNSAGGTAAQQGVLGQQSPAGFLAGNPRTDATVAATIGGTLTVGNVLTLTVTLGTLPEGLVDNFATNSVSASYTTIAGDTVTSMAEGLINAVNSSSAFQAAGIFAESGGEVAPSQVVVHVPGPVGNFAVLSGAVTGSGQTETITLVPSNGKASGGSGPVIILNNFNFAGTNGQVNSYWYGNCQFISYDLLAQMVAQGMPVG